MAQEAFLARTILIVDDDAALVRLYAEALAQDGHRVVSEREGNAAIETFKAKAIDLVVIDALLPGWTGFELAEQLRKDPRGAEVPLLFVSGIYKAARHRADVIDQFRAVDFLEKPVAPGELCARIRIALGPEVPAPPRAADAPLAPTPALTPLASLTIPPNTMFVTGGLRGELSQRPFHDVFAELARTRATGLLAVRREKVKKIISLRDGRPVAVKSNLLADCLGRVMVRAGTLTDGQCAESLELMRARSQPQGQMLLELGFATERSLEEALELQLEQKLFDVFAWETGDFQFHPRAADDQAATVVEMSAARALQEGLARAHDERRLLRLLGASEPLAVRLLPGGAEAVASLANGSELAELAASMNGTRALTELLDAKMVPDVQALALVLTLKLLGLAEFAPPRPATSAPRRATTPPRRTLPPPDPANEDAELKLTDRLAELEGATFYEILGVPRSADAAEIRRAYVALARDHHPDKHYANARPTLRTLAARLFARFTEAHETLSDEADRRRYDEAHAELPAERAERILRADEAFRAGRTAFDAARYAEATVQFREAVDGYPEEAVFHAWHALASWQAQPDSPAVAERAFAELEQARALHPRLTEVPLFVAHLRRALGEEAAATAELARAQALSSPASR